tara:strand:+ start:789 stop:1523 length:735 start_codon:yes stop_codon:yes gene_type:complete
MYEKHDEQKLGSTRREMWESFNQQPESNTMSYDQQEQYAPQQAAPQFVEPVKRKLIITYSRTVQARQFEPATVSATMEADLPANCTLEEAMNVYENEMMLVKAAVLSQQNLPFELSENERMVQEVFGENEVMLVASTAAPAQMPAPTQMPPPSTGGFVGAPTASPTGGTRRTKTPSGNDVMFWDMLVADPSKFWDNRAGKTNPNAPDFKMKVERDATPEEKKEAKALWLNACPDKYCAQFGVEL